MNCVVIGAVSSTKILIDELYGSNINIDMVFSLDEKLAPQTSGYYPLHELANELGLPTRKYIRINDRENIDLINKISPDYIFAIGFSQLISQEIIDAAKIGVIGFHPTSLPKFRGRAAVVWQMLLKVKESKVSMFFINEKADAGDIIGQETYYIDDSDYAIDVHKKIEDAEAKLIKKIIPLIENNKIISTPQDESKATYLLKRIPEDGIICWNKSAEEIQLLVRATSKPYPGAFSYYKGSNKVIIWKADYLSNDKYYGYPGQIAHISESYIDVLTGEGILRVYEYECDTNIKFIEGHRFMAQEGVYENSCICTPQ